MATESWAEKSRALAAAGLVVMGREAQTKIEELTNLSPLIEAATASSTRLLTSQSIDELLTIVPTEETITESNPEMKLPTLQATWQDLKLVKLLEGQSRQSLRMSPRLHLGLMDWTIIECKIFLCKPQISILK